MATRAERRRRERAQRKNAERLHPDGVYGVQPGWFHTMADLEEAKKSSHDMLIASMGDRRIGPVHWRWWTGVDAFQRLNDLRSGETDAYAIHVYNQIGRHLRQHGGYLIIALAEGASADGGDDA